MTGSRQGLAASLVLTVSLTACDSTIGSGPDVAVPVIQSLLVAGDSVQAAWVEWRTPSDSTFTTQVRPVPPALVQLRLILPSGDSVAFAPAAGVPGRFDASVVAAAGGRYLLRGTVAGYPVTAAATIPDQIDIREPVGDTVTIGGACDFCDLPFRWFAGGTDAYWYVQFRAGGLLQASSTRDTAGVIQVLRATGTTRLAVYALEPQAAAFLIPRTPKSSITGVFGLFGAASRQDRWIVWQ
jgi:hypothetical protein